MKASQHDMVEVEVSQYKMANMIGAQIVTNGNVPRFAEGSPMLFLEVRKLDFRRPGDERDLLRRLRSVERRDQRAVLVEPDSIPVDGGMLAWTVFGHETVHRVQLVIAPLPAAAALIGELPGGKIYAISPSRLRARFIEPRHRLRAA